MARRETRLNAWTKTISAELGLIFTHARKVWELVSRRYRWSFAGAILIMVLSSACSTALPLFLGRLVDGLENGIEQGLAHEALYRRAGFFLALMGLGYLLREVLHVVRRYLVENACTCINRDMSIKLMAHLMKVHLDTFSRDKVGALHGRILRSVEGFVRFLRLSFLDFLPPLLTGIFALTAAFSKQPMLGLVMAAVIPASLFLTIRQLISQKGVRLELLRNCEEIDGTVVEQLSGMEYVRASNTHELEVDRLAKAAERRQTKEIRHYFTMSLFGSGKALNEGLFHVVILGCSIHFAITGAISIGDILAFSVLYLNIMAPLHEVHRVVDEGHESSLRVADLLKMLALPVDRSFAPVRYRTPRMERSVPVLVVENLVAEYKTADGKVKRALNGVSFTIHHGETIGIAGASGSGKSTLLKVLLRLAHPCSGKIVLGGAPLGAVSHSDLGRLVGYVGQYPFLFAGTIAENIAYGNGNASSDAISRAARMAHLHEEILRMPGGYQTMLCERGQNLSGGQRQRVALARILLKQPPILFLDEATSALDNISERHVQRALGLTSAERTTILVAHRLSTLIDADRILVFQNGRIVETGTYHELLELGGVFTELALSAENGVKNMRSPPIAEPPAKTLDWTEGLATLG